MHNLNFKQQRFVEEYLISGVAYDAALKAGYSEKYAFHSSSNMMRNPRIKAAIEEGLRAFKKDKIMEIEEAHKILGLFARGGPLKKEIDGKIVDVPVTPREQLRALEMVLKIHGQFIQTVNVNANVEAPSTLLKDILDEIKLDEIKQEV